MGGQPLLTGFDALLPGCGTLHAVLHTVVQLATLQHREWRPVRGALPGFHVPYSRLLLPKAEVSARTQGQRKLLHMRAGG